MSQIHRTFLPAGVLASAMALVLTGCAGGTPDSSVPGTSSRPTVTQPVPEPAAGKAGGNVRFTDYTDNDGTESTVILTGAIGDFGKALSVNPDGSPNPDHTSELDLRLRDGTFRVWIAAVDKQFVDAMANFPTNTKTCSGNVQVTGALPIVAGTGTGAYKNIGGSFDVTVSLAEVDQLNGCRGLLRQLIYITGSGTVTGD